MRPHLHNGVARALVAAQGFLGSGNVVLLTYSYFNSKPIELTQFALRVAAMEAARHTFMWFISSFVWWAEPGMGFSQDQQGTVVPLCIITMLVGLPPALAMIKAPWMYRRNWLPEFNWSSKNPWRKPSFLFLALSDIFAAFHSFSGLSYMQWWVLNGWTTFDL